MLSSELLADPKWAKILEVSARSTKCFAQTFLPETFYRPFAKISDELFTALDSDAQKTLILAPRGFGKTSLVNFALPLRYISYGMSRFIAMVSATADKAMMDAENLKMELESNELLRTVFGSKKTDEWSTKRFVAGDTFVIPRGAGQQIRGLNYKSHRPDLIVVDDLETAEGVMSDDQRAKLKQWFFADLLNSVDRGSDQWKIVVIGTLLHEDALIANLLKDPEWNVVQLSLCDENFHSNWPEFMSDQKVLALYESMRKQGQADVFAMEYTNVAVSKADAVFRSEYFRYYEPSDILQDPDVFMVTIVDPAKTVKLHSADSAVVTLGVDLDKHKIYFHDCTAGKMHPDELYDAMFEHVLAHGSRILAVEVTSLHEFITQPIKNEMTRRGIYCEFVELAARGKKAERVAQLAPFYRQGYIYHNRNVSAKLELQLMSFPRSELWDVMDATAYIVEVLELDDKYFFAQEEPGTDEYSELMNDRAIENWRQL